MNVYLKLLLFCFLVQNIRPQDSLSFGNLSANNDLSFPGLIENNSSNTPSNIPATPVLFNCSQGINTTDLSKCTPVNITLSFECTKINYDFLIFSTAWQPKLCSNSRSDCRSNENPRWRIQGLRAAFLNGTRPIQCCSDKQLKLNELSSILPDIREKWSYEKDSGVENSIIEDWNLHGSCVQESDGKTSEQLFSQSIELSRRLNFDQWLSSAKIEPSNEKKYGLQFFNYTLSSHLNKRFQLRCKTFDYERRISIIDVVNVCVDRRTSEVIDCPTELSFDSNCLDMVYYPNNLLEYKVPDEVLYRDMNYFRYNNYHRSYSPLYGNYHNGMGMGNGMLTGAALGAGGATAILALPAAYYFFKNQNRYKNNKYNSLGGLNAGSMPWYSSTSYANTFAQPPNYGTPKNFGNIGSNYNSYNNLYPKQNNFLPPAVYASNPGLNRPPSYPGYSNSAPSYPPYSHSNSASNPSYPPYSHSNSASNPSYPPYRGSSIGNMPQAPPPYSKIDDKSSYPKQSSSYDKPPPYSSVDQKNKPSYPPYSNNLNDKSKNSGSLYPKMASDSNNGKYSPSAPSYPTSGNKPSSSKSKSTGIFGGLFSRSSSNKSGGNSFGRGNSGRSGGGRGRARG